MRIKDSWTQPLHSMHIYSFDKQLTITVDTVQAVKGLLEP